MDKSFKSKVRHFHLYRKAIIIVIVLGLIIGGIYGGKELSWKEIAADEVAVIVNNLTGSSQTDQSCWCSSLLSFYSGHLYTGQTRTSSKNDCR